MRLLKLITYKLCFKVTSDLPSVAQKWQYDKYLCLEPFDDKPYVYFKACVLGLTNWMYSGPRHKIANERAIFVIWAWCPGISLSRA